MFFFKLFPTCRFWLISLKYFWKALAEHGNQVLPNSEAPWIVLECKFSAAVAGCRFYLSPAIALTPGLDSLSLHVDFSASIIITGCVFPGVLIESIPFVLVNKSPLSYSEDDPGRHKLLTHWVSKSCPALRQEPPQPSLHHKSCFLVPFIYKALEY